jgi:hypothetical protein
MENWGWVNGRPPGAVRVPMRNRSRRLPRDDASSAPLPGSRGTERLCVPVVLLIESSPASLVFLIAVPPARSSLSCATEPSSILKGRRVSSPRRAPAGLTPVTAPRRGTRPSAIEWSARDCRPMPGPRGESTVCALEGAQAGALRCARIGGEGTEQRVVRHSTRCERVLIHAGQCGLVSKRHVGGVGARLREHARAHWRQPRRLQSGKLRYELRHESLRGKL